jgi:hypothetical protein
VSTLPTTETNIEFLIMVLCSREAQLAPRLQVDYIKLLPSWKAQHFLLTGIKTVDKDLPNLYIILWPKSLSTDTSNALSSILLLHTAFASD